MHFEKGKQRIIDTFQLGDVEGLPLESAPSYNIPPTTLQPVIRKSRDKGEREMLGTSLAAIGSRANLLGGSSHVVHSSSAAYSVLALT
ncbi:MAG: hypothetical protein ABI380_15740, partial [Edaphobacter sp.]